MRTLRKGNLSRDTAARFDAEGLIVAGDPQTSVVVEARAGWPLRDLDRGQYIQLAWYFSYGPVASDLRIFTTGVEIVRTGDGHELYHIDAQQRVQNRLYPQTRRAGALPYNHLAYELLLYWPVARLPYATALRVWALMNLALVVVIAMLLNPYTSALRLTTGLPLVLWLLAFYPVFYVLAEGQDSIIFLTLVVLSLRCAESNRMFLAGFLLALACFKFHVAMLIAFLVFGLRQKWQGLAGFVAGAALVIGISRMMVGPTFASDYISMLRNQEVMNPWGFVPHFMPNLRGLLQWGLAPWLAIGSIRSIIFVFSAGIGAVTSWIILRSAARPNENLVYAAAIVTSVLVSYHMHMQDLTIAALPMLVLLDLAFRGKLSRTWAAALAVGISGLYGFRITAEFVPALLSHGCLLAPPLLLLWLVSLRSLDETRSHERGDRSIEMTRRPTRRIRSSPRPRCRPTGKKITG